MASDCRFPIRCLSIFAITFLLAIDMGTKIGALAFIPSLGADAYPFGGIGVFRFSWITFSLNTVTNTGAAWGIFSGYPGILFVLRTSIIIGLIGYLLSRRSRQKDLWPFWLVVVGAVGNAIDYALYGCVIDFIHCTFWGRSFPLFNFADAYITVGVFFLLFGKTVFRLGKSYSEKKMDCGR